MNFINKQREFFIEDIGYQYSAIYIITNTINNKVYIGQSVNYWQRAKIHRRKLESNTHENTYLQHSYNKNNKCFSIKILDRCKKEELNDREIHWIAEYKSFESDFGYNLTKGGSGKKPANNIKRSFKFDKRIPILCYTIKDEKFYKEYNSIKSAAEDLCLYRRTGGHVVSGEVAQTMGFCFKRKMDDIIPDKICFPPGLKMQSRLVLKLDINTGEVIERFTSLRQLVPIFGYHEASIRRIFRKKGYIIHNNYKYIYP